MDGRCLPNGWQVLAKWMAGAGRMEFLPYLGILYQSLDVDIYLDWMCSVPGYVILANLGTCTKPHQLSLLTMSEVKCFQDTHT